MSELRGKELGIAVAKEVMRWTEYGVGNEYPLFDVLRQKGAIFVLHSPELRWRQWSGWSSMDDAMEVVQYMIEYVHPFKLEWLGPHGDKSWLCYTGELAYANIAPVAILRAALKVVRGGRKYRT